MSTSLDSQTSLNKAIRQYKAAHHFLNVTFPLIKDPKIFPGILINIFSSLKYSIEAILHHERQLLLVPKFTNEFQNRFNIFRYKSAKRYRIKKKYLELIIKLQEIIELHKKSPFVFQRGNRFVICGKNYRLQVITIDEIRQFLAQTQEFLITTESIINRKE